MMNWNAINFDWNRARAFLATMEEGSLSGAARVLGVTQPTLGRQVSALEEDLGVVLFERSGRELVPTPAAHEIAEHVRAMGEAARAISLAATGQSQSFEGTVRVSATEMYAQHFLPGFVQSLQQVHPGIVIEIVATNELSDLRHREADIAIRNSAPTDPDMIARRLSDDVGHVFGSRALFEGYGPFRTMDDLRGVPFVGFDDGEARFLDDLRGRGVPISKADIAVRASTHTMHWELVRQGLGLGVNGQDIGLKEKDIIAVLPDELRFEFPVWLVAPRELKTNARLRAVFDALADHIAAMRAGNDCG